MLGVSAGEVGRQLSRTTGGVSRTARQCQGGRDEQERQAVSISDLRHPVKVGSMRHFLNKKGRSAMLAAPPLWGVPSWVVGVATGNGPVR